MSNWIRFHAELRHGEKRGLSKATRFIYLELSHEARARRGVVVLPRGMSDVDAVHEIVGGIRRETREAVKALTAEPGPMIAFEEHEGKRMLVVLNWAKWNPRDGTGAERQERLRNARRNGLSNGTSNGHVTPDVTVPVTVETEPRAHALLSLSSSLDSSLPSGSLKTSTAPDWNGERYVAPADEITEELAATAQLANVQDIAGAWKKFTGHYAGKWLHVAGTWQKWCVTEAKRERVERERARAAKQNGPADPGDYYNSPEAVKSREKLRAREARELAASTAPQPVIAASTQAILKSLGARRPTDGGT